MAAVLPLCAWCRRVRDEEGEWLELEAFLDASGTQVTHTICGNCEERVLSSGPARRRKTPQAGA